MPVGIVPTADMLGRPRRVQEHFHFHVVRNFILSGSRGSFPGGAWGRPHISHEQFQNESAQEYELKSGHEPA